MQVVRKSAQDQSRIGGNCSLDIHRGDPVRAACSDHRLHLNRYRRSAAALGYSIVVVLLTWVLVFQRQPLIPHKFVLSLQPFAIAGIVALVLYAGWLGLFFNLGAHLLAFFIIALACHGELARTRPAPRHLTTFYVSLPFGGMLGGLFSGLVAPYAFSWVAEYPILAVLAVLCRPSSKEIKRRLWSPASSFWPAVNRWFWPVAAATTFLLVIPGLDGFRFDDDTDPYRTLLVLLLGMVSLALLRDPPKSAAAVALAFLRSGFIRSMKTTPSRYAAFLEFTRYLKATTDDFRILKHGSTIHGAQMIEDEDGEPIVGRPKPITYYHYKSAMTRVIEAVRVTQTWPNTDSSHWTRIRFARLPHRG